MSKERWLRSKELFQEAVERPAEQRQAFLDASCGDDADLRHEVESLLASHAEAGGFLETPAFAEASARAPLGPAVAPGYRLGPYEIVAPIGSGAMGEVYRARDVRLGREVAVKVLPRELAGDPGRRERFEQEARAASALDHPNVVAVHDAGWHEGTPYIVTELLEGQTLADRLAQGPLPVRKVLECVSQAARGVAAAHERGVVHRDLKPANLFLTSQGRLKILDFGIAKLTPDEKAFGVGKGTTPGLILGTAVYMSPVLARGAPVDARSDQFSLGCVLYELLVGEPPFRRATGAETMAAVLQDEPVPVELANPRVPQPVAWIVERCLAKDPDDRYGATRDLARDLEAALGRLSEPGAFASLPRRFPRIAWRALFGAALAAAVGLGYWLAHEEPAAVPVVRYLTYSGSDVSPAAAPDGKTVAFSSSRDGRRRIWLMNLATGNEAPLTQDGDDNQPRFSPDGSTILFSRTVGEHVSLLRVPAVGGDPRKLVEDALYGDFSPDGRRLAFVRQFSDAGGMSSAVYTADADGSGVADLARLDGGAFVNPRWAPSGRTLAMTQSPLQLGEPTVIALLDTRTGEVRRLTPPGTAGVWPGALVWAGAEALVLSAPDSVVGQQAGGGSQLTLLTLGSGRSRPLLANPLSISAFDLVGPGRLVLEARSQRQSLRELPLKLGVGDGRWLTRGNSADRQPVYSRDGQWIAFSSNRGGSLDLWMVSRQTGAVRRLTDDAAEDWDPAFTPEGRLLWSSNRTGHFEIWTAGADGADGRQLTRGGADAQNPAATADGQWIVYASGNPAARGIWRIRSDGSAAATRLVAGNVILPEVAPDGQYLAFVAGSGSERSAMRVVRVSDGARVPFEVALPAWAKGGSIDQGRCRWLPDGRSLAYVLQEPNGSYAVYVQDFRPGVDTSRSRRRLAALDAEVAAESLAVSPDGASLTISLREQRFDLMLAENVPGLKGRGAVR